MDRDEEPRPQRPGTGGRGDGGHDPEDVVPHEYAAEEDEIDDGGVQGLKAIIGANLFAIEDLWGKIDPREGQADRLSEHLGPCSELLAAFFCHATRLLHVLEEMFEQLDKVSITSTKAGQNWQKPQPVPVADIAAIIRESGTYDPRQEIKYKLIAKVIEILGEAGVEVDEADVESWDANQRQEAVAWATAERQAKFWDSGVRQTNPIPRPSFIPEGSIFLWPDDDAERR